MKHTKIFLFAGIGALSIAVTSAALAFNDGKNYFVRATTPADYRQTLAFTATNLSSGSGSVTVKGNTFNYTGVVVDGNQVIFGPGSTLVFDGQSGSAFSTDGMVGGGFKNLGFTSIGSSSFTYTFNGSSGINVEAVDGESIEKPINTTLFNMEITSGSFTTEAFLVRYDCVAPKEQRILLVGEKDDYLNNANYPASQAYASLMTSLGSNVIVDELFETSARPTYTMAVLAKTSTKFYSALNTMLNENDYDAIVLQISPRCTPNSTGSPTVEQSEINAITSLKTRLHQETDNIYVFAIQNATGNPKIWNNNDNLKYTETEDSEVKTFEEMCQYYSDLSETMATAVEGKAMHFADCYSYYKSTSGLHYAVQYTSLRYMYSHVMYATFFNRVVPTASTYKGENGAGEGAATEKAMKGVRQCIERYCIS